MTKDKLKDDKLRQLKQQKKDMEKEIASLHGTGIGNKLKGVLIFFMVILLFLVLLTGMIKADIGGFGSGVLAPVIGNISGLNKILPAKSLAAAGTATAADTSTAGSSSADAPVAGNPSQAADNTQTADNSQTAANATGIAITSTPAAVPAASASPSSNAQTNAQSAADAQAAAEAQAAEAAKLADYVAAYSRMDAKSAASILGNMTGDLHLVAKILANMSAS